MADDKSTANDPFLEALDKAENEEERIKVFYNFGKGSIQDIARTHRLSVEEVLHILGLDDTIAVVTQGDMIDQGEAGPEVQINPRGREARGNFSTN